MSYSSRLWVLVSREMGLSIMVWGEHLQMGQEDTDRYRAQSSPRWKVTPHVEELRDTAKCGELLVEFGSGGKEVAPLTGPQGFEPLQNEQAMTAEWTCIVSLCCRKQAFDGDILWQKEATVFSCACWASVCPLWIRIYQIFCSIFNLSLVVFYWLVWAIYIFCILTPYWSYYLQTYFPFGK